MQWLISDHLGTPRIITDLTGHLAGIKRHDYLPFGEELLAGTGVRTQAQGYSQVDNVRQQFAGSERDDETALDFMQARYYSSTMGRFTSPDEPFADQEEADPQSWNLYSYVRNNPLRFIDPFGLARYDANGNWVGDKDGEYDKDLKAHWRVDKNNSLGGSWDFGGDQSPVTVNWTIFDEASMQLTVAKNRRSIAGISDDGCEDCAMEMGVSGRSLAAMARVIAGRTPSKLLDRSLRATGLVRPAGTAAHHIVAHGSRKASIARRILKRLGVDVNSAENGVYLPRNVNTPGQGATHPTLHTDRYYAEVDRLISTAQTKQQAVEILNYIRGELLKNTFPR